MKTIQERFESLGIAGNGIASLRAVPGTSLSLHISVVSSDRKTIEECELQFLRVLHSEVNAQGIPFFEIIVANRVLEDSSYLQDVLENHEPHFIQTGEFHHFVLELSNGFIYVIAEDFSFSVLKKNKISGYCGDIEKRRPKPWRV